MYTPREKLALVASLIFSIIAVGAALAVSCGWLASGGDRYRLFGYASYIDETGSQSLTERTDPRIQ